MLLKNFYISHFYYKYFGVSYEEIKQKDRRTTKNNVKLYKAASSIMESYILDISSLLRRPRRRVLSLNTCKTQKQIE
jgi:hypothetical protein